MQTEKNSTAKTQATAQTATQAATQATETTPFYFLGT